MPESLTYKNHDEDLFSLKQEIELVMLDQKISGKIQVTNEVAVALSGGLDSMALTHLLSSWCLPKKIKVHAITIDHGFRINSSLEAQKVKEVINSINVRYGYQISHHIIEIDKNTIPSSNIEAKLRELRYELLVNFCKMRGINLLFTAHHLGDVAENFLIRLFRGSGIDGLSSMSKITEISGILLARPLISRHKSELRNLLVGNNIPWFEDETNLDEKFLRNKIRNFFASFPDCELIQKRVKSASDEIAKARDIVDQIAFSKAKHYLQFIPSVGFVLQMDMVDKIDDNGFLKVMALTLMELGDRKYKPRLVKLKNFCNYLFDDADMSARNFYGVVADKRLKTKSVILKPMKQRDIRLKTKLKYIFETTYENSE